MKSTLLLAALLLGFSSTVALSQTESSRSTTRRSAATAKKQSGSTKKSKSAAKKQETAPGSSAVTGESVTSTPRRSAPVTTPAVVTPVQVESPKIVDSRPIESWYGYYGVGYAKPSYPGALQMAADEMSATEGVVNAGVAMDAAGLYAPYNGSTHLLVGGVVNLAIDVYADETSSITMTQASVSSSALYFVDRIGEGPFVRGDVGVAAVSIVDEMQEGVESPVGVGVLAGAGYAMPLSNGTGLMFNVNYSARVIDGETFGAVGATVGVLF